jgi:hypothetical protein
MGRVIYGVSSGEGVINEIRDPLYRKKFDKRTRTSEEELVDPGVEEKRLLISLDEFYQALSVMRRETNTLSAVLRTAWSRDRLSSPSKISPVKAAGAHVSIIAGISRSELLHAIEKTDAENGTLNRFLWVCIIQSRRLPEGGGFWRVLESDAWRDLQARFNRNIANLSGQPVRIERDADAQDDWGRNDYPHRGMYYDLSQPRAGTWGAVTARAAQQVMRLSLIIAVINGKREIRCEHQNAAYAIWRYCADSTKYIFGDTIDDPLAGKIMEALRQAGPGGLTRSDVLGIFHRNRPAGDVQAALAKLAEAGLAKCTRAETGGRPVERWYEL